MKKILVSTIPVWSQISGSNTFSTLLEGIKDVQIANIYFRAGLPDSKVGNRYFQITESNVIKSILKRNIQTGKEIESCDEIARETNQSLSEKKRYAFFLKHRNPLFLWGRELLWKLGNWKSKELNDFLDDFHPDVFMFPIESYIYFNRINEYIIKHCKPRKVIAFWWDDNFTYKQSNKISYYISRYFVRRSAKQLMKLTTNVLAISPKMKAECDAFFSVNSIVITKPIRLTNTPIYKYNPNRPIRLLYTGSMVIGRQKSLIAIANALKIINRDSPKAYLDIFSSTILNTKDMRALNIPGSCTVKGNIPQSQVFKEQADTDILVFVESFKDKSARLSFSTKLTDYLSAHRCILAIGPDDISSIEYLRNEDAAIICTTESSILSNLKNIINTPQLITEYAEKGWSCGIRNHDGNVIKNKIRQLTY